MAGTRKERGPQLVPGALAAHHCERPRVCARTHRRKILPLARTGAHPDRLLCELAVGFYNAPGGYIIGKVWKDPNAPNPAVVNFPDGTVACKLLFTTAPVDQVPYLKNDFEWQANVSTSSGGPRSIQTVRLLQVDVAVRDSRANSTTGWVFGTFVYDGNAAGATPWDRLEPVGLMWGNDPAVTEAVKTSTTHLVQIFINPAVGPPRHLAAPDD